MNPKASGDFALLRITDLGLTSREVRKVPILLQKSQKAPQLIFRQRTKQATISDHAASEPLSESPVSLAHDGAVPLRYYWIVAPMALRV